MSQPPNIGPVLLNFEVTSEKAQDDVISCNVCHAVPVELPIAPPCSHTFCSPCIHHALEYRPECPVCHQHVIEGSLLPITGDLRHAWEQIAVKCPACQWTGNLGSYQAHFSRGSSTITGVNEVDQLRERCKILEESLEKERSQVRLLTDSLAKECSKSFDLKLNLEDANMKKSQAETRAHCLKGEIEKAERRLIVTRQGSQILLSRMQREVLKARQPSIDKKTFPVVRSNTTADSLTDT